MMIMIYVCLYRSYDVASKCVAYLLYLCSDVEQKYKDKLDQFEYACSHLTDKDGMHVCVMILFMLTTLSFKLQIICIRFLYLCGPSKIHYLGHVKNIDDDDDDDDDDDERFQKTLSKKYHSFFILILQNQQSMWRILDSYYITTICSNHIY